jgi:hypothetical protein
MTDRECLYHCSKCNQVHRRENQYRSNCEAKDKKIELMRKALEATLMWALSDIKAGMSFPERQVREAMEEIQHGS